MQHSIQDYIIGLSPDCFEEDENFRDVTKFKEWLLREREDTCDDTTSGVFQFFYSIVQEMTEFRFHAEERFKDNDFIARNKRRELPISSEDIIEKYFHRNQAEPPETVVSRIAQNQIHVIDAVLFKIRKVLRRERELTRVANVQQLDSQCLVWLTRQPGITAIQKAGTKQKLMSIVRKENYDILENRVLKAVLKLCSSNCQRYLQQYAGKFSGASRIKAVKRLYGSAQIGLKQEIMDTINSVRGIPQPNYVLLHDQYYSQIWQMYLALLNQTLLMEHAWRNRLHLLQEYFLFCFANVSQVEYENSTLFHSQSWISVDIKNNGNFIKNSSFRRIFIYNGTVIQFIPRNESANIISSTAEFKCGDKRHSTSLVYLPNGVSLQNLSLPDTKNNTFFVFSESKMNSFTNTENIVPVKNDKDLFYQLDDWFKKFMRSQI